MNHLLAASTFILANLKSTLGNRPKEMFRPRQNNTQTQVSQKKPAGSFFQPKAPHLCRSHHVDVPSGWTSPSQRSDALPAAHPSNSTAPWHRSVGDFSLASCSLSGSTTTPHTPSTMSKLFRLFQMSVFLLKHLGVPFLAKLSEVGF